MHEVVLSPQQAELEGQQLFTQQRYQEAVDRFSLAERAYAEAGDKLKAAEMLNNIGVVYRRAGQHKEAARALEDARQTFADLDEQQRKAQVLGNLGGLYSKMKRYDQSEVCFREAVALFQELDDRGSHAEALRAMAIMQFKRGQRSKALTTYEDALYFLPKPNPLQRFVRFLLKLRSLILRWSPLK